MVDQARGGLRIEDFSFSRRITLGNLAAFTIAAAYLLGYLIDSIYVREFGVESSHLLKGQFMEAGLVFLLIICTASILPYGTWWLVRNRIDSARRHPYWTLGLCAVAINYCFVLLFFVLFVTKYEWQTNIHHPEWLAARFQIGIGTAFNWFVVGILLIIVFAAGAERTKRGKQGVRVAGRILLFTAFVISCWFDLAVLLSIDWVPRALEALRLFLVFFFTFWLIVHRTISRLIQIEGENQSVYSHVYLVTSSIFCLVLFYLVISSYAFGVYPFMPTSRGGKLPVSAIVFDMSPQITQQFPELVDPKNPRRTRPLFILDRDESNVVVLARYDPFAPFRSGPAYTFKNVDITPRKAMSVDLRGSLEY